MKDKIYIVGMAGSVGLSSSLAGKKISEMENVEFITPEQAKEMEFPHHITRQNEFPIIAPIVDTVNFDMYKDGQTNRRERRKQARKK
jgi:hypothetical protein